MARKQYPSDHRRYFRVMEDILDDPKLSECSAAECWMFIALLACLNRMKSRDGKMTIPLRSVHAVSHTRDWSGTRTRLDSLQNAGLLCYERAGKCLRIEIPNWPKTQGFTTAKLRRDSVQTPSPTPTPTPTPTREEKKEPAAVAASLFPPGDNGKPKSEKRARRAKKTPFPDPFPLDLRVNLKIWAAAHDLTKAQVDYAIDFVRDWSGSNDKLKKDWEAAIRNGMRAGWALPKPGGPTGETPEQRYARMAREMEKEEQDAESR